MQARPSHFANAPTRSIFEQIKLGISVKEHLTGDVWESISPAAKQGSGHKSRPASHVAPGFSGPRSARPDGSTQATRGQAADRRPRASHNCGGRAQLQLDAGGIRRTPQRYGPLPTAATFVCPRPVRASRALRRPPARLPRRNRTTSRSSATTKSSLAAALHPSLRAGPRSVRSVSALGASRCQRVGSRGPPQCTDTGATHRAVKGHQSRPSRRGRSSQISRCPGRWPSQRRRSLRPAVRGWHSSTFGRTLCPVRVLADHSTARNRRPIFSAHVPRCARCFGTKPATYTQRFAHMLVLPGIDSHRHIDGY